LLLDRRVGKVILSVLAAARLLRLEQADRHMAGGSMTQSLD
jgi:hypothetical protein